jgi:YVTN family beta-propeller protein
MTRIVTAVMTVALAMVLGVAPSRAQKAYVTNSTDGTVTVIATANDSVLGSPITVNSFPVGVAVTPDGNFVYVANGGDGTVSVIATATNTVFATITVGIPQGVAVSPDGSTVYVTSDIVSGGNVSVIQTSNNTVLTTVPVGSGPQGVVVTPNGNFVYVANGGDGTVSVIQTSNNTVLTTVPVGTSPEGVAVTPDGSKVYVANFGVSGPGSVSVINTATNTLIGGPITVGIGPEGVAVTPDGKSVYVTNELSPSVSVIDTATEAVTDTISNSNAIIFSLPVGVAVTPDGTKVYVANNGDGVGTTVAVIDTATNTVTGTITVGNGPFAFGNFIGPPILTVSETGTGTGQVTSSPAGINCSPLSTQCALGFAGGTAVTLTATANAGSMFSGWSGGGCRGTSPCVIDLTNDTTVSATFTVIPSFLLTVTEAGTGSGTVTSNLSGINCPGTCSASYQSGTQVVLTASAAAGSSFTGWSGGGCSGTSPCTVTMSAAESVTATFAMIPSFMLSVTEAGTGSGTVTSNLSGINCPGACSASYQSGTQVVLTAVAASGSTFAGWNGAGCVGTGTCTVTMTAAESVSATFTAILNTLTVTKGGTGSGTVTSGDGMIACGATCSAGYAAGAVVTLTATPDANSTFTRWGGACSGAGACQVTMSAAESVSAIFTAQPVTLTVTEVGTGAGQVTSNPVGINCSASSNQCAAQFAVGTQVTLTASASVGSSFTGWSGGVCSGTGTCQLTLSADTTVTASFKKKPTTNMLSVVLAGGGSGTVTSSPSGINCGPTCTASFDTGTQITLSAAAAGGSTFSGWSGGGCNGTNGCTLTLNADTTVTASFVVNKANLTLLAAVLPTSRSVEIGTPATAFATMINAGPADAATCTIAPQTGIPASFVFQTTDPITNALTGTANTPANIAAGQRQSFVIALTPTAAFAPTNVAFTFTCANAPSPAASIVGVDTLNLSASATPVPDVIALAASADPGYVDIPGVTGTGVFAVATVNLGIDATITVTANTGMANLPVTLTLCQTAPTGVICLAPPAATVTADIQPNAIPAFGVFVAGSGFVADMPAVNRVFVTFTDSNGVLRGETSVAVRTQ